MKVRATGLVIFALALASCRSRGIPVTVDWGAWPGARPEAPVMVQFNHRWRSAEGRGRLVPLSANPHARPGEDVVAMFVDADGDGRPSPLTEPRTICVRETAWVCRPSPVHVGVNRYRAVPLTPGALAAGLEVDPAIEHEGTEVVFEAYDARTGKVDDAATLCATADPGLCLRPAGAADRDAAPEKRQPLCGAATSEKASFRLTAGGRDLRIETALPRMLPFEAKAQLRGDGAIVIRGKTPATAHLAAWLRVLRAGKPELAWNTEQDAGALAKQDGGFTITIPRPPAACSQGTRCLVGVQAWAPGGADAPAAPVTTSAEALALALVGEIR
jgi:hypothetical protein